MESEEALCQHAYSCALCENRSDLRAPCCCQEADKDLFEITEPRLLKRCDLVRGDKVCTIHLEKINSGMIFGGGGSGCCAPFHVGPLPGRRLRPVPRIWRQMFDNTNITERRYMPSLQICATCYRITLDIVLNAERNDGSVASTTDAIVTSPKSQYTSPRRWLSSLSLNMPGSSSGGSSWSLASLVPSRPTNELLSLYSAQRERLGHPRAIPDSVKRYFRSRQKASFSKSSSVEEDSFNFSDKSSQNPGHGDLPGEDDDKSPPEFVRQVSNASLQLCSSPAESDKLEERGRLCFKLHDSDDTKTSTVEISLSSSPGPEIISTPKMRHAERLIVTMLSEVTDSDDGEAFLTDITESATKENTTDTDKPNANGEGPSKTLTTSSELSEEGGQERGNQDEVSSGAISDSDQERATPARKQLIIQVKSILIPPPCKIDEETNEQSERIESSNASVDSPPSVNLPPEEEQESSTTTKDNWLVVDGSQNGEVIHEKQATFIVPPTSVTEDSRDRSRNAATSGVTAAFTDVDTRGRTTASNSRLVKLSHTLAREVIAFVLKNSAQPGKTQADISKEVKTTADKGKSNTGALQVFANTISQSIVNFVLKESSYQLLSTVTAQFPKSSKNRDQNNNQVVDYDHFCVSLSTIILQDVDATLRRLNACERCATQILSQCVDIVVFAHAEAERVISNALEMLKETNDKKKEEELAKLLVENAISSALLSIQATETPATSQTPDMTKESTSDKEGEQLTVRWLEDKNCYRTVFNIQVKEVKLSASGSASAQEPNLVASAIESEMEEDGAPGVNANNHEMIKCIIDDLVPVTRSFSTGFLNKSEDEPTDWTGTFSRSLSFDSYFTLLCKPTEVEEGFETELLVESLGIPKTTMPEPESGVFFSVSERSLSDSVSLIPSYSYDSDDEMETIPTENSTSASSISSYPGVISTRVISFDENTVMSERTDCHQKNDRPISEIVTAEVTSFTRDAPFSAAERYTLASEEEKTYRPRGSFYDEGGEDEQLDSGSVDENSRDESESNFLQETDGSAPFDEPNKHKSDQSQLSPQIAFDEEAQNDENQLDNRELHVVEKSSDDINNTAAGSPQQAGQSKVEDLVSKKQNGIKPNLDIPTEQSISSKIAQYEAEHPIHYPGDPYTVTNMAALASVKRQSKQLVRTSSESGMLKNRGVFLGQKNTNRKPENEPEDDDVSDVINQAMDEMTPRIFRRKSRNDVGGGADMNSRSRTLVRAVAIMGLFSVLIYTSWRYYYSTSPV